MYLGVRTRKGLQCQPLSVQKEDPGPERERDPCPRPQTKLTSGLARSSPALPLSCDPRGANQGHQGLRGKGESKAESSLGLTFALWGGGGWEAGLPFCLGSNLWVRVQ